MSDAPQTMQPPPAAGVGARLRAGREAAGLSLEQAALQLKLHPRQVKALEEEDYAHLPGRTFVRGFVRNYARVLNLNSDELLLRLADGAALGSPELHSTGTRMAELPTTISKRSSLTRWLIPLALIACIVAAAAYEWRRSNTVDVTRAVVKPTPVEPSATPGKETALPNPLTTPGASMAPAPAAPERK